MRAPGFGVGAPPSGPPTSPRRSFLLDTILRLPLMVIALSCLYAHTDSETSHYNWRLDVNQGKVVGVYSTASTGVYPENSRPADKGSEAGGGVGENDSAVSAASRLAGSEMVDVAKQQEEMLEILLSTEPTNDGTWKKTWSSSRYCSRCNRQYDSGTNPDATRNNRGLLMNGDPESDDGDYGLDDHQLGDSLDLEVLDCGKPVNFTYYDHLVGIQNRAGHPHIPEPEVALTFQDIKNSHYLGQPSHKKRSKNNSEVSIDDIERSLKKAKREKPKSVELYNQIGNFWRIRGDTQKSIECFRRALAVSPNNADILLNLARVLFNLQYLDDAIVLTRRSLEVQPPDQNAWAQHFQLGEILKAYCHYQEAALHLRHVLELKPNYGPALTALADMEALPDSTVHVYTVLIIVFLVLAVLLWIVSTLDYNLEDLVGFSFGSSASSKEVGNGHASHLNGSTNHRFNRFQRLHSRNGHKRSG